jgi:ribonuclease R
MGKKRKNKIDQFAAREAQKYAQPIPSREFILETLTERDRPASFRQIADDLEIDSAEEKEALKRRLTAMVRDGQLHQNRRGAYGLITKLELIPGHVIGHKDGYGFLVPEDGSDDLFLNARQMRTVFHGDKVLARVSGIDHRGRREGMIVEVLEHNTHRMVGRLINESGVHFVQPSNTRIPNDILIPIDHLGGALTGQVVVIEITTQPSSTTRPVGKVVEIIGDHMAPGMEIDVAIRNHDLPTEWPSKALHEAKFYSPQVTEEELKGRVDLRKLPFVTIDGEDAKDFDDAVYCQKNPNGTWTLYVAIADVSHYVKPHSALDEEALNRGNSVYFPGRVIPMLPEVLSNELCSLNPYVNRLTLTCEMSISATGKITSYKFHETVIKSHARLTYNDVYAAVEQNDKALQEKYHVLLPHLKDLFELYRILHKARVKRGAIDFDLPETKIIFGAGRKIERIVPLIRNDAHRVIEECMLCANICAAKFLLKNECPGLYRIHQGPSPEKLADLRKFLGEMGLKLPGTEEPVPKDYAALLNKIADRPDAHVIQTVLLRSLSQAIYSAENIGHFGLAYEAYTHFTSPIRRYPDLLVHRAIRKILRHKFVPGDMDANFVKFGDHCSMTERRADEATREAMDWLKCEFMLDKVGEEFDGVISAVTSFGVFVELKDIYVEGLVHISSLHSDYYSFDPIKHALIGERSGRGYRLGDSVRVKVARVDLDQRKIDFALAEDIGERPDREMRAKMKKKAKAKKKEKMQRQEASQEKPKKKSKKKRR